MNNITKQDIIRDYNEIFSTHGLCLKDSYYKWILSLLGKIQGKTLLDIACGEGILLREALKRGAKTFGIDISYEALRKAHNNTPISYLSLMDGENISFNYQFDYITCLGSLEHFLSPERGCKEIIRLLKNVGKALIVLPNQFSMHAIFDVLFKGKPGDEDFQIIERVASFGQWKEFLRQNGFKVLKVYKINQKPVIFKNGKIRSLSKFFRNIFFYYLTPFYFAREFAFLCEKDRIIARG